MNFGKNKISAVFALLIVAFIVLGCGMGKPEMPNDAAVQTLVKNTTSDFADALDRSDFKALRDKASADFQSQFSEDTLKSTFKIYTDNKEIISPIIHSAAGMSPSFAPAPAIREENGSYILSAFGSFATTPAKTEFTYEYVWRDSAWKLLTIKYNIK